MAAQVEEQAHVHEEPEQLERLLGEQPPQQQEEPERMVQEEDEVDVAPVVDAAPEQLLNAEPMDIATQAFTSVETATQACVAPDELLNSGSTDMATQAFSSAETAMQVEVASIEYSTQVVPEAALQVFAPTQVATVGPSAMEREEAAKGSPVAVSKKKACLSAKHGRGKGAAAKARARTLRTVEQLKRRAGPKKPKGSYSIWLGENRKKVRAKLVADGSADPSFEDIARAAGKTWSALTREQKAPYVERAKVLSAKYKDINKACKEYKKANTKDLKAKAKGEAKKAKQVSQKKKEASSKKAQKQDAVGGSAKKAANTPQKRTTSEGATKPTPSKAKKMAAEKTVYLDMGLLAEAEKAGLGGTFRRLAEREDMKQYSQRVLLDALVANEGLLHRAKDWVLAGKA